MLKSPSLLRLKLNLSSTHHWPTFYLLELDCISLILWVLPEQNIYSSSIKTHFSEQTQGVRCSFDSGISRVLEARKMQTPSRKKKKKIISAQSRVEQAWSLGSNSDCFLLEKFSEPQFSHLYNGDSHSCF